MAARCTTPAAAMHHFCGMGAPWCRCRSSGGGVCFARSGCRITNGQGVVLARRTHFPENEHFSRPPKRGDIPSVSIFNMLNTKITRFEFCTIQSGLSANKLLRSQCWSKKSGRKPVVRHAFSAFEKASFPTGKCLSVFCNKNKEKLRKIKRFYGVLVRVGRLELPASCSQTLEPNFLW